MSRLAAGTSARDALDGAITAIGAAGCETPRLDAEVLLAHVLGVSRARLLSDRDLTVEGPAIRAFQNAVRRRSVEREPVAYITGTRGFRHLDLAVDPRALIPRPETELLVEVGLSLGPGVGSDPGHGHGLAANTRVLDLGTGSGAVALALKHERPELELAGSDVSREALALALENGERLGLEVQWLHSDLLADVPDEFDAILSNPPYVPDGERATLAPEILRHEPSAALFAGVDGLALVRQLIAQVAARARPRLLALEIGAGQAPAVEQLMRDAGFETVRSERDLSGIERVVVGERVVGERPAEPYRLDPGRIEDNAG